MTHNLVLEVIVILHMYVHLDAKKVSKLVLLYSISTQIFICS